MFRDSIKLRNARNSALQHRPQHNATQTATRCNTDDLDPVCNTLWRNGSTPQCMPHIATHCNALQHTATHCNTLQHTHDMAELIFISIDATHSNALQHIATHCNALQHTATHCNALQHTATHCDTLNHDTAELILISIHATHSNTLQHHTSWNPSGVEPVH